MLVTLSVLTPAVAVATLAGVRGRCSRVWAQRRTLIAGGLLAAALAGLACSAAVSRAQPTARVASRAPCLLSNTSPLKDAFHQSFEAKPAPDLYKLSGGIDDECFYTGSGGLGVTVELQKPYARSMYAEVMKAAASAYELWKEHYENSVVEYAKVPSLGKFDGYVEVTGGGSVNFVTACPCTDRAAALVKGARLTIGAADPGKANPEVSTATLAALLEGVVKELE